MVHSFERLGGWLSPLVLTACLAGCGKADAGATVAPSAAPSAKSAASAAPSSTASGAQAVAPAAPGVAADWVDIDLTPGGKFWAPFTMKGPAGAKVKKGTPDPEVEAGDFAVSLSVTHTKKSTASLDTARGYGVSWRPLTDTPELFEYETSGEQNGEKFVRYNFTAFMKVDGKPMACSGTNNQKEREKLVPLIAACRTLRKK